MAITDLYIDYGIQTAPDGHKHAREGWLNCECPHCTGSQGYHLGFSTLGNYFYCWRCGPHTISDTLSKLLDVSFVQAKDIATEYSITKKPRRRDTSKHIKIGLRRFKYPSEVGPLTKPHRKYLEKRNFDPVHIAETYGVLGTGPSSKLDKIYYKYRILVPFWWGGEVVSFQCRDYTDRQSLKYMACPEERERQHHKHILYPHRTGDVGICVEGVFDVWRLGPPAFATLGIGYTREQIKLMSVMFKKVFIIFDPERQAREQAVKLQQELRFRGVEAINYTDLDCDPADLSDEDAEHLMKELKL